MSFYSLRNTLILGLCALAGPTWAQAQAPAQAAAPGEFKVSGQVYTTE